MYINVKMIPVETITEMGEEGDKGYMIRTFVNATMYPQPA
jgi:hypothetical protein